MLRTPLEPHLATLASSASVEDVSRFCRTTVSTPPPSSSTSTASPCRRIRPRGSSRLVVAPGSCSSALPNSRIFSGRTVGAGGRPASSTLETPTKPATNSVCRMLVDLGRRAELLDPPVVEHRQPVAHGQRLVLVVRDVDEGDADLALDPLELDLHLLAELEVERPQRLVQQQHLGAVDDRPGERDPLALAARQLRRLAVAVAASCTIASASGDTLGALAPGDAAHAQPVADVVGDSHVREERVVLEDGVDLPGERRIACDVPPAEVDRPASGRSKPAISRRVVVLPEPDGPSMVKNSPAASSRSTPSTARTSP